MDYFWIIWEKNKESSYIGFFNLIFEGGGGAHPLAAALYRIQWFAKVTTKTFLISK